MSDIWHVWFGHLTWPFLQFANDLRDTDLLQLLHARLSTNQNLTQHVHEDIQHVANKVDVHEDVKDMEQILPKTQRSATVVQQMPLKPAVFHGQDHVIEEITQLLVKEETSRVCILGPDL